MGNGLWAVGNPRVESQSVEPGIGAIKLASSHRARCTPPLPIPYCPKGVRDDSSQRERHSGSCGWTTRSSESLYGDYISQTRGNHRRWHQRHAAALRLSELSTPRNPLEIHLFEAGPRLGGLVASEQIGDCLIERGADSFITNKPGGVQLCRKLGLESQLIGTDDKNRRSLILARGVPIETPEGLNLIAPGSAWSILKSPILSWRGKLRCLLEPLIPRREQDGDESLASFTTRRLGKEMLDRIVQPMVGGIYTADPRSSACWPHFHGSWRWSGGTAACSRPPSPPMDWSAERSGPPAGHAMDSLPP